LVFFFYEFGVDDFWEGCGAYECSGGFFWDDSCGCHDFEELACFGFWAERIFVKGLFD
jgi:hypothetical protein